MKRVTVSIIVVITIVVGLTGYTGCSSSGKNQGTTLPSYALYEKEPETSNLSYNLTVKVEPLKGGNVTPGSGVYMPGENVTLSAAAAKGYRFSSWSGNVSGNISDIEPEIMIFMDADKTVVAEFTDISFPVAVNVSVSKRTDTTVVVSWRTSEEAMCQLKYGVSTLDYNFSTPQEVLYNYDHSVILSNMNPGATYHFRITAVDKTGNKSISRDHFFNTKYPRECVYSYATASMSERSLFQMDYYITNNSSRPITVNRVALHNEQGREIYIVPESLIDKIAPEGILLPETTYNWVERYDPPFLAANISSWQIRWHCTDTWNKELTVTGHISSPF